MLPDRHSNRRTISKRKSKEGITAITITITILRKAGTNNRRTARMITTTRVTGKTATAMRKSEKIDRVRKTTMQSRRNFKSEKISGDGM
jgi:hypothetical protein